MKTDQYSILFSSLTGNTKKLAHISQIYYFCKVEFHSTYTMVTKCLI